MKKGVTKEQQKYINELLKKRQERTDKQKKQVKNGK